MRSHYHTIATLIFRQLKDVDLSVEEQLTLRQWLEEEPAHKNEYAVLRDSKTMLKNVTDLLAIDTDLHWQKILTQLQVKDKVNRFWAINNKVLAAAAVVICFFGIALFKNLNHLKTVPAEGPDYTESISLPPADVKGSFLTMPSGKSYNLDSLPLGKLPLQGYNGIKFSESKLVYHTGNYDGTPVFNRLTNSFARLYQLCFSDGTIVWLDAHSSIRFPTSFLPGQTRKVELIGQAYFEIKSNPAHPFIIQIPDHQTTEGGLQVEALGTRLNVSAFPDSQTVRTVLFDGAVKLSKGGAGINLRPSQEGTFNTITLKVKVTVVDTARILQWKNNYFDFSSEPLPNVLDEVGHWYGVNFVCKGDLSTVKYGGNITKDILLSSILKHLEGNPHVKFTSIGNNKYLVERK